MKFQDTVAYECRYGDIAERIWGDWNVLWEDSDDDYQGHASILAEKDGKYCWYEWWYGSCPGSDTWEAANLTEDEIETEMRNTALWLDSKEELTTWLDMCQKEQIPTPGGTLGYTYALDLFAGRDLHRFNKMRVAIMERRLTEDT